MTGALDRLAGRLEDRSVREAGRTGGPYRVPARWIDPASGDGTEPWELDPVEFWRLAVDRVRMAPASGRHPDDAAGWSADAAVYNLFVRCAAAFDHNGDGRIEAPRPDAVRETGTFVKAIALLPYIRDLGCNVVHLLPISRIGRDGRKGRLGSPYAIQDPFAIDESLAEPRIGLGAAGEFAAFVDAAHRLGLRVVVEFVFRTAAIDAVWAAEHPDWFYWIRADLPDRTPGSDGGPAYGPPRFSAEEVEAIRAAVSAGSPHLPEPPEDYRGLFTPPPEASAVRAIEGRWIGTLPDGRDCRIPGAFADWPPDDPQPLWGDVTYLRLYDHPEFNYIAYNTVRMYDRRLARPENAVRPLWERIAGILPWYQREFAIDGAMIDMGHALPRELRRAIVDAARRRTPAFAFWAEDFDIRSKARADGYDAVLGNFWWAVHRPDYLRGEFLPGLAAKPMEIPFCAAPETHNTPRAAARGGSAGARRAWLLGCFLPAIPFVHGGFELGETAPVNTGLDFGPNSDRTHPPDRLALYQPAAYDWARTPTLVDLIRTTLQARDRHRRVCTDRTPGSLVAIDEAGAFGYVRRGREATIWVMANAEPERGVSVAVEAGPSVGMVVDPLSGRCEPTVDGRFVLEIEPSGCAVRIASHPG